MNNSDVGLTKTGKLDTIRVVVMLPVSVSVQTTQVAVCVYSALELCSYVCSLHSYVYTKY